MAHGKALELRGIRSRVAKRHWTKRLRPTLWGSKGGMETRQSIRTGIMSGGTSEDRAARFRIGFRNEVREAIRLNRAERPDLYAWRISPKSRARLRYEARRERQRGVPDHVYNRLVQCSRFFARRRREMDPTP